MLLIELTKIWNTKDFQIRLNESVSCRQQPLQRAAIRMGRIIERCIRRPRAGCSGLVSCPREPWSLGIGGVA